MRLLIVHDSHHGRTRQIAEAVAEGARGEGATVTVLPVGEATLNAFRRPDLLVVGGPTHMAGTRRARWRRKVQEADADHDPHDPSDGIQEWLKALPVANEERLAAAFDTRLPSPITGGASHGIARALSHRGFTMVDHSEGFVVETPEGPLRDGERNRARAWGARLVGVASGRAC